LSYNASKIDSLHTVETAEGARMHLVAAGPVVRGIAWSVDLIIRIVIFYAVIAILGTAVASSSYLSFLDDASDATPFVIGIIMLVYFLISNLYTIVFEASISTTPGKRLFNLIVVHDNATPLTVGGSILRNLLRAVDFLPLMYFIGLVSCLTDNRFRRLGDLVAGSLVIYKDSNRRPALNFSHERSAAPPNALNRAERKAIVDFAERSRYISSERQEELAQKLSHLMDDNADPVDTLKCWAEWTLRGQADA